MHLVYPLYAFSVSPLLYIEFINLINSEALIKLSAPLNIKALSYSSDKSAL